ncbi:hypothetical protein L2E82_52169 [Cichorium intybus]|nr:hypothetical protein L2E82_52169 [Cichorium intybus]
MTDSLSSISASNFFLVLISHRLFRQPNQKERRRAGQKEKQSSNRGASSDLNTVNREQVRVPGKDERDNVVVMGEDGIDESTGSLKNWCGSCGYDEAQYNGFESE